MSKNNTIYYITFESRDRFRILYGNLIYDLTIIHTIVSAGNMRLRNVAPSFEP